MRTKIKTIKHKTWMDDREPWDDDDDDDIS